MKKIIKAFYVEILCRCKVCWNHTICMQVQSLQKKWDQSVSIHCDCSEMLLYSYIHLPIPQILITPFNFYPLGTEAKRNVSMYVNAHSFTSGHSIIVSSDKVHKVPIHCNANAMQCNTTLTRKGKIISNIYKKILINASREPSFV